MLMNKRVYREREGEREREGGREKEGGEPTAVVDREEGAKKTLPFLLVLFYYVFQYLF